MKICLPLLLFSIIIPIQFDTRTEYYLAVGYTRPTKVVSQITNQFRLCSRVPPRCNPETSVPRRDHMRNFDRLGLATYLPYHLDTRTKYSYYLGLVLIEYGWCIHHYCCTITVAWTTSTNVYHINLKMLVTTRQSY